MIDQELKPCPFCGSKAILVHTDLYHNNSVNCSESIRGLYSSRWHVECSYCGTARTEYTAYYHFTNNGTLEIKTGENGRQKAIDSWNRRANNGRSEAD